MKILFDNTERYGFISRLLHWGMAVLFMAQFLSAIAHWALPRDDAMRETLWSYHFNLGTTLFLIIIVRGIWGLANISRRPKQTGKMRHAAIAGHMALYLLMVIVPILKIISSAGSTRGFSYLGVQIISSREAADPLLQAFGEWHGELGWVLGLLIIGHIAMAVIWHRIIKRDSVLKRMTG